MTETLHRPTRPTPRPPRRTVADEPARSPWALGAAAALWAALLGLLCVLLPVLAVWAVDDRSGVTWGEAARSAGRFWLVAHGASLDVPGGRYALTPLGLLLLPVALVARFTTSAVPPGAARPATRLALAVSASYAVLALLVAVVCTGPDVHVSPVQSLLAGLLVGGAGATVGVLRPQQLWRVAWHRLTARTRRLLSGAAAATALLLGAAALLAGASLAFHFPRAFELAGASEPWAVGGLALLLGCLALVPNAVVWSAAWLSGPGFAVGVGTGVSPFAHDLGPVPALPLIAALPAGGLPEWGAVLVLAVPLLAGAAAGRLVATDLAEDAASWPRTVAEAAAVGPVCGAVLAWFVWLSGGAAGGERLVELGPSAWSVGLAVSAAVGVGSVVGALLRRARMLG